MDVIFTNCVKIFLKSDDFGGTRIPSDGNYKYNLGDVAKNVSPFSKASQWKQFLKNDNKK